MKNLSKQYLSLRHSRASALILSIWILVFFSILSAALYKIVSSHIILAKRLEERIVGYYLVKSLLLQEQDRIGKSKVPFNTLAELRQKQEGRLASGEFNYHFIDEESKVNVNTAAVEVIARLPGMDMDLAQAVKSSNMRPFRLREQILLVDNIDEETYNEIKPHITVYTDGRVNINTAGPEVLKALGMDDDLMDLIRQFRAGEDETEGTEDDGVFTSVSTIVEELRSAAGFSGSLEAELLQIISKNLLTVLSENLFLRAETSVLGRPGVIYEVLMTKDKIKEWHEY